VTTEGKPPEDDRRFVNNPFARALHPLKEKRTVGQWIALATVSIFGALVMGAAFLLPPAFAYGLIMRAHGRIGMIAAGGVVVALYALLLVGMLRRRKR